MATVATGAVIASASKYLIAWRRRLIVNPAVAGAVGCYALAFAGVGQVDFPFWWVAAEPMLIPMIVVGALVVTLIRDWQLVTVFVVASLVTIGVVELVRGGQDLRTWIVSSPMLFVAAIMLPEPLTSPATRLHRLIYAALVGVLMHCQHTVEVTDSYTLAFVPEVALLVGCSYAFAVRLATRTARRVRLDVPPNHSPRTRMRCRVNPRRRTGLPCGTVVERERAALAGSGVGRVPAGLLVRVRAEGDAGRVRFHGLRGALGVQGGAPRRPRAARVGRRDRRGFRPAARIPVDRAGGAPRVGDRDHPVRVDGAVARRRGSVATDPGARAAVAATSGLRGRTRAGAFGRRAGGDGRQDRARRRHRRSGPPGRARRPTPGRATEERNPSTTTSRVPRRSSSAPRRPSADSTRRHGCGRGGFTPTRSRGTDVPPIPL